MESITAGMKEQMEEVLSDYGKIKERLVIRLCNRETDRQKREQLEQLIHRDFLDFLIMPYIDLSHVTGFPAAGAIPYRLAERLGVTEGQVMEDALANSPKIQPAKVSPLSTMLDELLEEAGMPIYEPSDAGLSVITTDGISYGAAAILYPGVLGRIAEEKGADLLLIPSSVHEFLALADTDAMTKEELEALIRDVNRNEVAEGDVLSNHLYRYERKTGEIRRA